MTQPLNQARLFWEQTHDCLAALDASAARFEAACRTTAVDPTKPPYRRMSWAINNVLLGLRAAVLTFTDLAADDPTKMHSAAAAPPRRTP